MNAKPNSKSYIEITNPDIGFEKHIQTNAGIAGQDIFVDGDPALANWAKKPCEAMTVNSGVGNDLKTEKLNYIHQMLMELRKLSLTMDEPMIAYLIEMALLETNTAINLGDLREEIADKPDTAL